MIYLLFDPADDTILAECESAKDLLPMMKELQSKQPEREVRIGWFIEHQGELVSTRTVVTARTLSAAEGFALYG